MTSGATSDSDADDLAVIAAPVRYTVRIEALEAGVRVPLDAQIESQPVGPFDDSSALWNEAERQLRLAGAA